MKTSFLVQMTDTYGGEANYCWVKHFLVYAKTRVSAMSMIARETGHTTYKDYDTGHIARYNVRNACICFFINETDEIEAAQVSHVVTLGTKA